MKTDRKPVDEQMCRTAQLLLAGGANGEEAAKIMGVSTGTISRIKRAGFDLETFRKNTEERRIREREAAMPAPAPEAQAEEQVPGQISMDLAEKQEAKPEMSDQVKLMRFLAGKFDCLEQTLDANEKTRGSDVAALCKWIVVVCEKLDKTNDYLGQILRRMDR